MKNALRKIGLLLTLVAAMLFITGCPGAAEPGGNKGNNNKGSTKTEYTVSIFVFKGDTVKADTYKVEEGDTLASISKLTDPVYEGYTFDGYYTILGEKVEKTAPIESDLVLYTKFTKVSAPVTEGNKTTTQTTIKTAEKTKGTTGTKLEVVTENADGSTTTTTATITIDDETDKKVSQENSTETVQANGEATSSSELTIFDDEEKPVTTVETNSTTTLDESGNLSTTSNTTTTTTEADGTTTTVQDSTVTDSTGNSSTTTTTTVTDASGEVVSQETTSDVQAAADATVHQLVELGVKALVESNNIVLAKGYFDEAYKKDSNDDEAKVYSALSDLTSISTNAQIQKFFKDHLGITNYPSDLNALISGAWATEGRYETTDDDEFYGCEIQKVTNSEPDAYYYYKVSLTSSDTEGAVYSDFYNYEILTINNKDYFVSHGTKDTVERNLEGRTDYFIGRGVYGYDSSSWSSATYVIPDENGRYWGRLSSNLVPDNATAYKPVNNTYLNFDYVEYTYPITYLAPKFNTLKDAAWFTTPATNADYFTMLVVANIVNGNTAGLNSAIDDLYEAMFNSDEYKSAIAKINSITKPVALPSAAVDGFKLQDIFGAGQTVQVGATELKLLKTALDLFKGIFEYIQSYSFNTDLSFLKIDYSILVADSENGLSAEGKQWLKDNFGSYNAANDPINNGFLSVRSSQKMADSKATFMGVLDDIITVYDSITGKDSIYPTAITDNVKNYSSIRAGAVALKDAIENGSMFFIPNEVAPNLTEWPAAPSNYIMGDYILRLDCGKLFTAGTFALDNIIGLETVDGKKKPVFYAYNTPEGTKKITSAEALKQLLADLQEAYPADGDDETYYDIKCVYIPIKLFNTITDVANSQMISQSLSKIQRPWELNITTALMLYNFYYGGLEDEFASLIDEI